MGGVKKKAGSGKDGGRARPGQKPVAVRPAKPAVRKAARPAPKTAARKAPKTAARKAPEKAARKAPKTAARKASQSAAKPIPKRAARAPRPVAREIVRIRDLDPHAKCGPGTSVERLIRVDEMVDRRVEAHLVFLDRHGWYCEHGASCHAVGHARKHARAG